MSKTVKVSQEERPPLSGEQEAAIPLLLAGKTDAETAAAVGVSRQTVNGWANHDIGFIAAVNYERREVWRAQRARLQEAMTKATETVLAALNSENEAVRLKTALYLLEHCGLAELTPDVEETAGAVEGKLNPILHRFAW
jgi:hypothetical protein